MVFVACGLNHKTAPIEVREKFALTAPNQAALLERLVGLPEVDEATVLSTCNRTEFYCQITDPQRLVPWLAKEHHLNVANLSPHFYLLEEHEGIRHLLRVATGLDSLVVGEPQILGQMKHAYQEACQMGTVKTSLRQVFEYTFSASKRVRTLSGIGVSPVSVAYAGVQLITRHFSDLLPLKVFLIGSGETSTLVAKYLHKAGVRQFLVANRTHDNAQQLASAFDGVALDIGDIPHYLAQADIVVSATACPLPFINKTLAEHALRQRQQAPMFFLDLAVPRDIEASVGELPGATLFNVDDLHLKIEEGMNERRSAALQAEQLIDCELENYIRWHRSLQAKSAICRYREHMNTLAQQELKRAVGKLSNGSCQQSVLIEFCDRLVNKLLHTPTAGLQKAARDGRHELIDLMQYIYTHSA